MNLSFNTDRGIGTKANLGLIVLQSDETIEHELAPILRRPGVALYHNRIPVKPQVSSDTLAEMEADLPATVGLLPPSVTLDVIGYGCTSAATVIGPERVADAVRTVRPDAEVTEPISATIAACRRLDAQRIGFVTPYVAEVSARMRAKLEENGCEVVAFGSFNEGDDRVVARIAPDSILDAIVAVADDADCDAVFVSCTNLRVAGIVEVAENRIGRPVLSSNLALAWHMQTLAGIDPSGSGPGRLLAAGRRASA